MKIVIFYNFDKPEACEYAEKVTHYLLAKKVECFIKKNLYDKFVNKINSKYLILINDETIIEQADFIVTFGGDGTILGAVKKYIDYTYIPIMGINVGRLGFLAEFSVNKLYEAIDNLLSGKFKIINRELIETKYNGNLINALNDFVIEKKDLSKMITLKAYYNKQFIGDYRADGLIITTSTGSTAYSLSCGGPLIYPSANVFCVTPICPHSLTLRPLILPYKKNIKIKVFSTTGEAIMTADGQSLQILKSGDILEFYLSKKKVRIIVPTNSTYFEVIRNKFLWAEYPFN